jgi:hypothetical protein
MLLHPAAGKRHFDTHGHCCSCGRERWDCIGIPACRSGREASGNVSPPRPKVLATVITWIWKRPPCCYAMHPRFGWCLSLCSCTTTGWSHSFIDMLTMNPKWQSTSMKGRKRTKLNRNFLNLHVDVDRMKLMLHYFHKFTTQIMKKNSEKRKKKVLHIPVNSKRSIFPFYIFSYSLLTHCSWAYKPTINIQESRVWLVITDTVKGTRRYKKGVTITICSAHKTRRTQHRRN